MPFYIGSVLLHFRTRYQLVYIEIVKLVTLHFQLINQYFGIHFSIIARSFGKQI